MDSTSSLSPAWRRGFGGHVIGQATGAINDNLFRKVFHAVAAGGLGAAAVGEQEAVQLPALLGLAFILPFLVLAPTAGSLADRCSKRRIMLLVRLAEPLLCLIAALAILLASIPLMIVGIALLGIQSALFSPVKYAAIPELVPPGALEDGNGRLQAVSNLAILGGIALAVVADPRLVAASPLAGWGSTGVVLVVSLLLCALGICATLRIPQLPGRMPERPIDPPLALRRQLRVLGCAPGLVGPALALAGFWGLSAMATVTMDTIVIREFGLGLAEIAGLNVLMAVGLAIGSLLAPRLMVAAAPSGLPLVGGGILSVAILMGGLISGHPEGVAGMRGAWALAGWMTVCGLGGGLLMVPLNVLLQQRAPAQLRGSVFAATGILGTLGLLVGFVVLYVAGIWLSAWQILTLLGALGLVVVVGQGQRLPGQVLICTCTALLRLFYKVEVIADEGLPMTGGAVIVANHISYADGALMFSHLPRRGRFLVFSRYVRAPVVGWPLRAIEAIPIDGDSPARATVDALRQAVAAAQAGAWVVIFPEGKISRNGHVDRFSRGLETIAGKAGVPIIPAYLDGLERDWTARTAIRQRLPRLRRRLRLWLGAPLPPQTTAPAARRAVLHLAHLAAQRRAQEESHNLASAAIAVTRRRPFATAITDAGGSLSRLRLVAVTKAALPLLDLAEDERRVGVLLPPGRGGAIANLALALAGRTAVNLNHTVGPAMLRTLCEVAGLRTIITARAYTSRIGDPDPGPRRVFLEDLLPRLSTLRVLAAMAGTLLCPSRWQARHDGDDVAQIIFSSGSTGIPKGIQLSHRQILANCRVTGPHLGLRRGGETVLSPLPLFHSFGSTVGLWLGLVEGLGIAAHPDPTDATGIGRLAAATGPSFLISTPTFVRGYLRRIEPEQFASLRFAIVGAEPCPPALQEQFQQTYGAELLEGYGCTELGPVISVNVPLCRRDGMIDCGSRSGSVGRPLPGIEVLSVDPETGAIQDPGRDGLLVVRSPARMCGYLDQDERTRAVFVHQGYDTGDIGHIDDDGYIFITGRLSRFAKIGGEMVPLDRIEQLLITALRQHHPEHEGDLAISAVPDTSRGERLILLHTGLPCPVDDLLALADDLPALFRPRPRDCHQVAALPSLGTGKRDLKALKELAQTKSL